MADRTRIAVVGAGWWSTTVHLPALRADPLVEIVAIVDPDSRRASSGASSFDVGHSYSDVERMLDDLRPDGVVIATPHHTHADLATVVLASGAGALVEKPLATTAEDAWRLVELARSSSGVLVAGLTYQFAACAPLVQDAVRNRIGDLTSINAEFSSATHSLFATDPSIGEASLDEHDDPGVPHGSTYSDPSRGGGQGYTQLSHLLGGVVFAAGEQATDVFAFMDHRSLRVDVVDALSFRLGSGAVCVASSAGTVPAGVPPRHRIRFHGTAGMVEWDMLGAEARLYSADGRIEHFTNPVNREAYASKRVATTFAAIVAGRESNPAPADYAAASIALIAAAYQSAESGLPEAVVQGRLDPR